MNPAYDIPGSQVKPPTRMPNTEWDKIMIDERRKREVAK